MTTLLDMPTRTEAIDALLERARELALQIDRLAFADTFVLRLAFADTFVLRGAARERLSCDEDLALPAPLRPLLNRALDIIDISWLEPAEATQLEHAIFDADRRSVRDSTPSPRSR